MPSKSLKVIKSFNHSACGSSGKKPKRPAPFSLRLSHLERKYLDGKRGDMSLHAYIRHCILGNDAPLPSKRKTPRVHETQALAQVLGQLGRSNISNNLNQLAKAIHTGSITLPDNIATQLNMACRDIASMRSDLLKALGLRGKGS